MNDILKDERIEHRLKLQQKEEEFHNVLEQYSKQYRIRVAQEEKEEALKCFGVQRRCDVCNRTYTWKHPLVPEDVENMAINVEEINKHLTCCLFCYLIKIGKFFCKLPRRKNYYRNLNIYYAHYCGYHNSPYFLKALNDYAFTKLDEEHYQ